MIRPWLYSAGVDSAFLLAPAFLVTAAVLLAPEVFADSHTSPLAWLVLVVGVDVSHVYSTLWRTYFSPEASARYRTILIGIPVACWIAGVLLYVAGSGVFWRVFAYVAAFHFVRQQYGFLRLYSRNDDLPAWKRKLDAVAIHAATLYPLLYWHTHTREFHWFVAGDFIELDAPALGRAALWPYLAILVAYAVSEIRRREWNLPKNLILAGTALSWYTGIVAFNGDLAFTITNVVSHGIPYMALVWIHQRKRAAAPAVVESERRYSSLWFRPAAIPLFLGVAVAFAYVEEGFWDALIWRDHAVFYGWLGFLPQVVDHDVRAVLVPLLALPQATHYVLDGFIWKVRDTTKS